MPFDGSKFSTIDRRTAKASAHKRFQQDLHLAQARRMSCSDPIGWANTYYQRLYRREKITRVLNFLIGVRRVSVTQPFSDNTLNQGHDERRRTGPTSAILPHTPGAKWEIRPARFVFAATILVIVLVIVSLGSAALMAPQTADKIVGQVLRTVSTPDPALEEARNCAKLVPIATEAGDILTHLRANCIQSSVFLTNQISDPAGVALIAEALAALEGGLDGRGVLVGVDARGLIRALMSAAEHALGLRSTTIGGTAPIASSREVLLDVHPDGALEKLSSILASAIFTAHKLPDRASKEDFVAHSFVCIRGQYGTGAQFGTPLAGGFCSELFGRDDLDGIGAAEACYLAGTAKRAALAPGPDATPKQLEERDARHKYIKDRAATCLDRLAASGRISGRDLDAEYRRLEQITPLAPKARRGIRLRQGAMVSAHDLLNDYSLFGSRKVTLDRDYQEEAERLTQAAEAHWQAPLETLGLCVGPSCPSDQRLQVLVALAETEADGQLILRAVTQSHKNILFGSGGPDREPSLASTNKLVLLPLLAEEQITEGCTDRAQVDLGKGRDPDCQKMALDEATALSQNAVFIDALSQLPEGRMADYLAEVGYHLHPQSTQVQTQIGVVMGFAATAAPSSLIRFAAALQTGRPVGALKLTREDPERPALDLADRSSPEVVARAQALAANPIFHPKGTARAAAPILEAAGCLGSIGKTGTVDAVRPVNAMSGKVLILSASCGGRDLTAMVYLSGPNGAAITGITSAQLAGMAARLMTFKASP